jgi:thioredoxin 1
MESTQSAITVLHDISEFKRIISDKQTGNNLYIIDFHAKWCKPCKKISPDFEKLSIKYTDVMFLKCDVDESDELSALFDINSLPTFVYGYGKNIIDKFEGANIKVVERKLQEYTTLEDRQYTLLSDFNKQMKQEKKPAEEQEEQEEQQEEQEQEQEEEEEQEQHQEQHQEQEEQEETAQDRDEEDDDKSFKGKLKTLQKEHKALQRENQRLRKLVDSFVSGYQRLS